MSKAWAVWSREYGWSGDSTQRVIVERMIVVCKTREIAVAEAMRIVDVSTQEKTCAPSYEQPAVMIRESADLVGF